MRIFNQRPPMLLAVAIGVAAVGVTWAQVARTIADATPPGPGQQPTAIVWAGRVFATRSALGHWLRSRGTTYRQWSTRYPAAAAVLERRPVAPTTTSAAPTIRRDRRPAVAQARPSGAGHGYLREVVLALMALAALACAVAAALPTGALLRLRGIGFRIGKHRDLLAAGAAALVVGLLIGFATG